MAQLTWDDNGERYFETGVKKGVLYPYDSTVASGVSPYQNGVAWNGLTAFTHSPQGAEATALYADDIKYLNLYSEEELQGTIEAYTYPEEFAACDGSAALATGVSMGQQARKQFGFCYRTVVGNDVDGVDHSYKLHLVYGCKASPSERAYATMNESPEAITMSWSITTTKTEVGTLGTTAYKPTSYIEIDASKADATKVANLEALLYGADAFSATSTYAVGDYVTYTTAGTPNVTKTYRCKTAITTAAAWDSTKWDEVGAAGPILPMPADVYAIFSA